MGFNEWLDNIKLKRRLRFLVFILLCALIATGAVGYHYLQNTNTRLHRMYTENLLAVADIYNCRLQARQIEADVYALMLSSDMQRNNVLMDDIKTRTNKFTASYQALTKMDLSPDEKAIVNQIGSLRDSYLQARGEAVHLAYINKNQEAYQYYLVNALPKENAYNELFQKLSIKITQEAQALDQQNIETGRQASMIVLAIIICSIILGFIVGEVIIRNVNSRIESIVNYLGKLADGDFSRIIPENHLQDKSEFGIISRAINKMKDNVKNLLNQSTQAIEQVASSSDELSASAEQSAQASNQVANSVTGVADSAEKQLHLTNEANRITRQIAGEMDHIAQQAQTVSVSAENTAKTANEGGSSIKKTVDQMKVIEDKTKDTAGVIGQLEDKSKKIGQIVDVISSIAAQTNLLALNAAIEAARAGEAGKGFAVVAEEVRKLAEQSQNASKQITDLIEEIQTETGNAVSYMNDGKEEVAVGAQVVASAGKSFDAILKMVMDMTDQIKTISGSVEKVTKGAQKVVDAVQSIDEESKKSSEETQTISAATEQQSASVGEIANASQNLSQMAGDLQNIIKRFKV